MFKFLLVVQALVTLAMIIVILMQRSEGGGLGMGGGSPAGLMSARGAADFLTRATTVLASLFIILSIVLAGLASVNHGGGTIDTSLQKAPAAPVAPAPNNQAVPFESGAAPVNDPLAAAAKAVEEPKANAGQPANAAPEDKGAVPLQK